MGNQPEQRDGTGLDRDRDAGSPRHCLPLAAGMQQSGQCGGPSSLVARICQRRAETPPLIVCLPARFATGRKLREDAQRLRITRGQQQRPSQASVSLLSLAPLLRQHTEIALENGIADPQRSSHTRQPFLFPTVAAGTGEVDIGRGDAGLGSDSDVPHSSCLIPAPVPPGGTRCFQMGIDVQIQPVLPCAHQPAAVSGI